MRFFGLEIRKADNQPSIFKSGGFYTGLNEMPATTIELFYKMYRKNSDLRRCVQEIQSGICQEGYFYQKGDDPVYELPKVDAILKGKRGFKMLANRIIRDIVVAGNAYVVRLKNVNNEVIGFATIDPRTVRIRADNTGEVIAYQQVINGKVVRSYAPDEVVNCYDELDPDNEIFGLSVVEGIITDVLADDESAQSNYYYFKNNAMPSMILKAGANVSDNELQNALEQIKKNFAGSKNKHKIGILKGIDGVEKLQDSISDMQFQALRGFTTNRICAATGVPKVLLGYTDGVNYTNADIQYSKFIQNTITPREEKLQEWFGKLLEPVFKQENQDMEFKLYNTTLDITMEMISIVEKKITNGLITVNEGREELGYEPYDLEEANAPLISKNFDRLVDVGLSEEPLNTLDS